MGRFIARKLTPTTPAAEVDRGEKAFITEWGVQSEPRWSPDGRKIAFVSTRVDHSFIVVYDVATRSVKYMSPSVDFDTAPMWMADSKHLIFMRQPGLAFGQQTLQAGAEAAPPVRAPPQSSGGCHWRPGVVAEVDAAGAQQRGAAAKNRNSCQ